MDGLLPGQLLPTSNNLIAVSRIKFDETGLPASLLTGYEGRTAATKAVENEVASARAVANGVSD